MPLLLRYVHRLLAAIYRVLAGAVGKLGGLVGYLDVMQKSRYGFAPRPDDIFIVTYPRSGTTWLQMILYQLTSDGNMDFFHINQKVPWFERALKAGLDLDALPSPRVFKSHLRYGLVPRGTCRYIYAVRDGRDVAVSYYHLACDYNDYRGTFDEFLKRYLRDWPGDRTWFKHVRGWRDNRAGLDVLYMQYEEMQRDLPGTVRRIAEFCQIALDEATLARVVERSQMAFMKEHAAQFDFINQPLAERGVEARQFLREGRSRGWAGHFSPEQLARYEKLYAKSFGTPPTTQLHVAEPAEHSTHS